MKHTPIKSTKKNGKLQVVRDIRIIIKLYVIVILMNRVDMFIS